MLTRWPLPALLSWLAAWGLCLLARRAGLEPWAAYALGFALACGLASRQGPRWRRLIVALGFPASALALGLPAGAPAWAWLAPLALLWLVYPRRSWGDAPVFPTPRGALAALPEHASLPPGARVLDVGCGAGDGLRELLRAYPHARVEGIEWSLPLRLLARWRGRPARVLGGDMWALDWRPYQLVYVFQRPESMPGVWRKACGELADGSWLVSLDFPVPEQVPAAAWAIQRGHQVFVYEIAKAAPKLAN